MRRTVLILIPFLVAASACGASIQAIYEGDVRFEHCMALDSRPDVKPTIRKACWEEWGKFYTFGQTRDRVEYAKLRQKQLSASSDFDEGEWALADNRAPSAVPEPTSVLEPPPMTMIADGGASAPGEGSTDAGQAAPETRPPPGSECASTCEEGWALCKEECKTPVCEKTCSARYKRCMRKCF